jgi:hypothetical protein
VHITLLLEGTSEAWSNDFGLSYPVIADNQQAIANNYVVAPGGQFGIPMYAVLDRELRIVAKGLNSDVSGIVADLLDEDPPDVDWEIPADLDDEEDEEDE